MGSMMLNILGRTLWSRLIRYSNSIWCYWTFHILAINWWLTSLFNNEIIPSGSNCSFNSKKEYVLSYFKRSKNHVHIQYNIQYSTDEWQQLVSLNTMFIPRRLGCYGVLLWIAVGLFITFFVVGEYMDRPPEQQSFWKAGVAVSPGILAWTDLLILIK